MKIYKDSLTQLASEGYLTLQVPSSILSLEPNTKIETEECPDEWFDMTKLSGYKRVRCLPGHKCQYLFLSRKGYETNKDRLKEVFEKAITNPKGMDRTNGRGWIAFEEAAEKHFMELEQNTEKHYQSMKQKALKTLLELKAVGI